MRYLTLALAVQFSAGAALAAVPAHGGMLIGETLVGVDDLGRVAVAVDTLPKDGRADHLFLYTALERLAGPWSKRFEQAQVFFNDQGALTVIAADRSYVLSVAVRDPIEPPHPPEIETFTDIGGPELAELSTGERGPLLDDLTHADFWSWPEPFWYDYLAPESGPCQSDADCQSGGKLSSTCSQSCGGDFGSCSVSCLQDAYACCKCTLVPTEPPAVYPECRCRPCVRGE